MDIKKYVDIERLKDKYANAFTPGEHITITEKIDGANASLAVDEEGNVISFSRRTKLTPQNNLRGFYEFVRDMDHNIVKTVLGNRYILFGEWLVKHTINYPENKLNQFYVFDVWDKELDQYTPWSFVKQVAEFLGLHTVPLFYDGPLTSWEEINEFVGKTEMCAEPSGEGIVIKSQDRLNNKSSCTPNYVKIVAEKFSEVHHSKVQKKVDTDKIAKDTEYYNLAQTVVTLRRVEKIIQKFVEDQILPEDWDEKNLGIIAKYLPKAVYDDCFKEEPEIVKQIENFGKLCSKISMIHARTLVTKGEE